VGSEQWGREILDGVDADTELGLAAARDALAVAAGELDEDEFRDRHEVGLPQGVRPRPSPPPG
jgi:hypothetical protein